MEKQSDSKKVGNHYVDNMLAVLNAKSRESRMQLAAAECSGSLNQQPVSQQALLSGVQVTEVERIQKACRNIAKLCKGINESSIANELGLPSLQLYELAWYMEKVDERIRSAKTAAKAHGVAEVLPRRVVS